MEAEGLDPMGEARGSHVQTMGIYERGGGGKKSGTWLPSQMV